MTTLVQTANSAGQHRHCDAKCYNATTPYCDCVCAGVNHGVGHTAAIANTRELVDRLPGRFHKNTVICFSQDVMQYQLPL